MAEMIQHGYWSSNGRIGRKVFLFKYFLPYFICVFVYSMVFFTIGFLAEYYNQTSGIDGKQAHFFTVAILFLDILLGIPCIVAFVAFMIGQAKRLHDTCHKGTWIVLTFVPFLNLALFLYLAIKKGPEETTEYGHNPVYKRRRRRRHGGSSKPQESRRRHEA